MLGCLLGPFGGRDLPHEVDEDLAVLRGSILSRVDRRCEPQPVTLVEHLRFRRRATPRDRFLQRAAGEGVVEAVNGQRTIRPLDPSIADGSRPRFTSTALFATTMWWSLSTNMA